MTKRISGLAAAAVFAAGVVLTSGASGQVLAGNQWEREADNSSERGNQWERDADNSPGLGNNWE